MASNASPAENCKAKEKPKNVDIISHHFNIFTTICTQLQIQTNGVQFILYIGITFVTVYSQLIRIKFLLVTNTAL